MRSDPEMDRRLQNWARWRIARECGGRIPTASLEARVDGAGWDAPAVIPTGDAEAEVTQAGVAAMEGVLRYAAEVWYLCPGSVAARCRLMVCGETEARRRVGLAQRALGQWL